MPFSVTLPVLFLLVVAPLSEATSPANDRAEMVDAMHTLEKDLVALTRDGADTAMEEEEVEPITMLHLSALAIRAGTLAYNEYWSKTPDMTACEFARGQGWDFIKEEGVKGIKGGLVHMGLQCVVSAAVGDGPGLMYDLLEKVYMGLALNSVIQAAGVAPAGQDESGWFDWWPFGGNSTESPQRPKCSGEEAGGASLGAMDVAAATKFVAEKTKVMQERWSNPYFQDLLVAAYPKGCVDAMLQLSQGEQAFVTPAGDDPLADMLSKYMGGEVGKYTCCRNKMVDKLTKLAGGTMGRFNPNNGAHVQHLKSKLWDPCGFNLGEQYSLQNNRAHNFCGVHHSEVNYNEPGLRQAMSAAIENGVL